MNKKSFLFSLLLCCAVISWCIVLLPGCAVMIPPGGGPRDSLPPVLVNATPQDSTLHFDARQVVLTFDEYVTLDNIQNNLIVSPNPKLAPSVTSNLKQVTIKIKDTLKPNTTYAYNFGKAVKDVNEGNILRNFTYVFSTGDHLDTDSIFGRVLLAETGKPDSALIVLLHRNLSDTAVEKLSPDYYTRLDSAGRFVFRFLPPGDFNIFVLPDDYNKRYTDSTQMFAFSDSVLHLTDSTSPGLLHLFAYQEAKEEDKKSKPVQQEVTGKGKKGEKPKALTVSTDMQSNQQDILRPMKLTFSRTLQLFDSSRIVLSDTNYHKIEGYHLHPDSTDTTHTRFVLQYPWKENQHFKLVMDTLAVRDSADIGLAKADTLSFTTKKESDYATIRLRFSDVDLTKHPVLLLFQNDKQVDSLPIAPNREVYRALYPAGDYELRILYDANQNLRWDPGNYKEKRQPEIVESIRQKFTFKPNWDNEPEIFLHGSGVGKP